MILIDINNERTIVNESQTNVYINHTVQKKHFHEFVYLIM